jgi:aldehyde dehydrogenase (NAD+)
MSTHHDLFIDGHWGRGGGAPLPVINPATEETIATLTEGTPDQCAKAIAAARTAFDHGPWPRLSPAERARMLVRFHDVMEKRRDDLMKLAFTEIGCTLAIAEGAQVTPAIEQMGYWAERAARIESVQPLPPMTTAIGTLGQGAIVKEPAGVVAAITPYNFPILLAIWKLGPALAAANTVVLKPSPFTPMSALILAEIAEESELPPGVLNVITGGIDVGRALTTDPRVDIVTFTGSDKVGREVMAQAATGLKKVVLELGGKSANLVLDDADLDDPMFVPSTLGGFITHAGQACAATTRILVHRSLHDQVAERLRVALPFVKLGDPSDPEVVMGPLIREEARQRVERYVALGREEGAEVLYGGERPKDLARGFFFEPTLFVGVRNEMTIAQDEIFGPVGVMIPFEDDEEAVRLANDSRYGLGGAVWSRNSLRAYSVAKQMRTGFITINGGHGGMSPIPYAPFGGYKHSGLGRENGDIGLDEYRQIKTIAWPAG